MLDTNSAETDGATAYVPASELRPELINSDWIIYSKSRQDWSGATISIECREETAAKFNPSSSAAAGATRGVWARSAAIGTLAAAASLWLWQREDAARRGQRRYRDS